MPHNLLMNSSPQPEPDINAKAVIFKKPELDRHDDVAKKFYYIFNRSIGGQITFSVVDMNAAGWGTALAPRGDIVSAGHTISGLSSSVRYGRHMAVVEDHVQHKAYVYLIELPPVLSTTSEAKLWRITISANGNSTDHTTNAVAD